jgi:hypothetical protein
VVDILHYSLLSGAAKHSSDGQNLLYERHCWWIYEFNKSNTPAKPSISPLSPKLRVVTPHSVEDVNMWRDVFAGNRDFTCFLCHFTHTFIVHSFTKRYIYRAPTTIASAHFHLRLTVLASPARVTFVALSSKVLPQNPGPKPTENPP